jgi:glycolate oxidase
MAMRDDTVLARLREELGAVFSVEEGLLNEVRTDRAGWFSPGVPLGVVLATEIEHVQRAVRIAAEFGVPVVPRGAGTGLAGGAVGTPGSLVISTAGMNRILEISPEDELAVVGPGVINQHLSDAAAEFGLVFSPDPASKEISSIGGNIATNAGGLLCAKYGVTREAVLGLTVVLADGTLLVTGRRSVKGVTGLDLTALLTGSEGTLGIIVEATVRLRPIAAGEVNTIGAFFPDVASAARASAAVTAARLRPAVMELMDHASLRAVDRLNGTALAERGAAFLLIQTDGQGAAAEAAAILLVVGDQGGDAELATDEATGERLLAIRRSFHWAIAALGEVLIEDVCVPRSQLANMLAAIEAIGARHSLSIPTIAHAGDGNLHPNFVFDRLEAGDATGDEHGVPLEIWAAAEEIFQTALGLGGTLTGEHGVGVLKRRWLLDEIGSESLELQRRIKAAFDPAGIMNPGKVFPV